MRTTILLGFVLVFLSGGIKSQAGTYLTTDSHSAPHFSLLADDLFAPASNGEQFFDDSRQVSSGASKISFDDYLSAARLIESGRSHLLAKYITFARYKVPRFQSHEICFPFHYFW